jgi:NDP-sugar pyrophosphorylase family protein
MKGLRSLHNNNLVCAMPPIVILAGGLATRLGEVSRKIPKSMVAVASEPFISHQLRLLRRENISRVVLCVGHLGDEIEDFVGKGNNFGLEVLYCYDGPNLLGTGGALKKALPVLPQVFLVMYGDSYLDTRYKPIVDRFNNSGKLGLMTVFENSNKWDKSNVEYSNETIICYDKKNQTPKMKHIDYGLSVINAKALDAWNIGQQFDLSEVYQRLLVLNELAGYQVTERFYEIGSPGGLRETDHYLSQTRGTNVFYR